MVPSVWSVCGENKFVRCNGLVVVLSSGLNLMYFMVYAEPDLAIMASLVGFNYRIWEKGI